MSLDYACIQNHNCTTCFGVICNMRKSAKFTALIKSLTTFGVRYHKYAAWRENMTISNILHGQEQPKDVNVQHNFDQHNGHVRKTAATEAEHHLAGLRDVGLENLLSPTRSKSY